MSAYPLKYNPYAEKSHFHGKKTTLYPEMSIENAFRFEIRCTGNTGPLKNSNRRDWGPWKRDRREWPSRACACQQTL